ncbi:MAG: SDR family NAD(P)-dependent oxidoreductase [Candidatus Sericytochromatia bacterium]
MEKEIALVTGGSKGIGKAVVYKLSEMGLQVHFTYNTSEDKAKEIEKDLSDVIAYKVDISNIVQVNEFVDKIIKKTGQIDYLVNNAGINSDCSVLMMDYDKWSNVLKTNLDGTFHVSKSVSKHMIKKRKGSIINISSVVASIGSKGQANYIASKSAIEGLTKALAIELAPRGILVNSIAPGFIETDMTNQLNEKYIEDIKNRILLKRFANTQEVANLISFFCSPNNSYITGQTIIIDGGLSLSSI